MVNLIGQFNAQVWAKEFMRITNGKVDESDMIGWFANAIMAGYDKKKDLDRTKLLEILGEVYTQDKHAKKIVDSELMVDIADLICSRFAQPKVVKEPKVTVSEIELRDIIFEEMKKSQESPDGFVFNFSASTVAKAIFNRLNQ